MKADGIQFVMIKAWEADTPDPNYKQNLATARQGNLPIMAYVWLHASDNPSRMQACFDYLDGAVIMLDWEQAGVPTAIVNKWQDEYEAYANRQGAIYYGLYPPDTPNARVGQWLRVFPEYCSYTNIKLFPWDGSPNPDWRNCWGIWQNSETATVDGIDGNSDTDYLAPTITIEDFAAWLDEGTPLPNRIDLVKPAIRLLQAALDSLGYNAGAPDGLWGPRTQTAIDDYSGYTP